MLHSFSTLSDIKADQR